MERTYIFWPDSLFPSIGSYINKPMRSYVASLLFFFTETKHISIGQREILFALSEAESVYTV